jgi:hypothetical protein
MMKITSVSPDGRYLIINIQKDAPYTMDPNWGLPIPPPLKNQIVVDRKEKTWWQLWKYPFVFDTLYAYKAYNFAWTKDSKKALCSMAMGLYLDDTVKNFPIYIFDLETREYSNLGVPWLGATSDRIPLFTDQENVILFFSPGIVIDTLDTTYTSIGNIVRWDTLEKKITEMHTKEEIADCQWMCLYDTTSLYIATYYKLLRYSLITHSEEYILPEIETEDDVRRVDSRFVFVGRDRDGKKSLYVYDTKNRRIENIVSNIRKELYHADMNHNSDFVLWGPFEHIYILSEKGNEIVSFEGLTPYWLAGSDTLVYSEGRRILKAWFDQKQQWCREVILEHTN